MRCGKHWFSLVLAALLVAPASLTAAANQAAESAKHFAAIAQLAKPSPMVPIPEGWFLMGTIRKDDDPYGMETQFDDTEMPQRRIWLDAYEIDR
ncbi:MAG: hypothetical protein D4R81_09285, partial [Nitrospiraceae bacterium]